MEQTRRGADWLVGGGEMGARIRAIDWSQTPLGPIAGWPATLRVAVGICLNSRFPMFVWWGPELINLYNDAYTPMLGQRHPAALGRPARDSWDDIWDVVGPQADVVMRRGEATWNERVRLVMERHGYTEETFFTWSYSPIRDESGRVAGLFCAVTEETGRVRAEERVVGILESITDGFFALDLDWRFTYFNAQAQRILGRDPRDVIGRVIWDEYPGLIGSVFEAAYRRAATEREHASVTAFYPDHGRWYEVHAYPAREGISVYFRDATDRERAEAALRASEERYRSFIALSSEGIWRFETGEPVTTDLPEDEQVARMFRSGFLAECNDAMARMYGFASAAEITGRRLNEFQDPNDPRNVEFLRAFVRSGYRLQDAESVEFDRDGKTRVFLNSLVGLVEGNRLVRVWGTQRDVTDRRAAVDALRESEARSRELAMVVQNSPDFIGISDVGGAPVFVNDAALRLVGLTWDEMLRTPVADFFVPEEREFVRGVVFPAVLKEGRWAGELTFRHFRTDARIGVLYTVFRIDDPRTGEPVRLATISRDVTELRRARVEREELLASERAARADAERASQTKDEFLATLSHELRTPLNAILGWAQILQTAGAALRPEDLSEGLDVIERNARAQTQIIEDLLDMSRIISGKIRLDVQRLDLASVVTAAVETVRPAADARAIRIQTVLDPHAGPVSGDPSRLQQVFWNLLSNAVKFTPKGGRVQVILERVNSHLEVSVIDTGEGIAPEFLPHVFDRFRQADGGTTRRHGGLGLGLAIVKQLVELHGGSVRAKSGGRGFGSTFTVALPLTVLHPAPDPEWDRRHPVAGAAPMLADTCVQVEGVKVLVVDDEPDARGLIKRFLEDCKAVVTTAASAREGFECVTSDRPDVLISDIGMPDEDGYSLIRRVRALGPGRGGDVPAIALTAYARAEDRMKAMLAGFQQHVVKPVEPAELITVVAVLAGRNGT